MNRYKVSVDVSATWDEDDIEVVSIEVEEENATFARIAAREEIVLGKHDEIIKGRDFFVKEIVEIIPQKES